MPHIPGHKKKKKQPVVEEPIPSEEPIKEIDKPIQEQTGIVETALPGLSFRLPDGRLFSGLNTDDIAQLEKTAVIQNARLQRQEETRKQEIISETEIPQGRELEETAVGAFAEAQTGLPQRSGLQILARTPLGQAMTGKVALDLLKKEGRGEAILELTNFMLDNGLTPEQVSSDPGTQAVLSLELNENDIKVLKSGKADVSRVAVAVEGVSILSGLAKLAGGAITPTTAEDKITDLEQTIIQIGNSIRDWRMAAARTPSKKPDYLEMIFEAEQEIRDGESKIKLLTIQSPNLQNAPEKVQTTQAVIDRQLNRLGDARNAMIIGETLEQAMAATQVSADANQI